MISSIASQSFFPHFQTPQSHVHQADKSISESGQDSLDAKQTQAEYLVDKQVLLKLQQTMKSHQAAEIRPVDDYAPEKVADNILSFVKQAYGRLQQNQTDVDAEHFFEQARSGIEQGFSEAKDILEQMGALNGVIAENVDKTYQLTMDGLDDFEQNQGGVDSLVVNQRSIALQTSKSASVEIETREGDVISINLSQSFSAERNRMQAADGNTEVAFFEQNYQAVGEVNIAIEGDLNADEKRALEDLLAQMGDVSKDFFQGNQKQALKEALSLGFDTSQIAEFSMNLQMQRSVEAVSTYQQAENSVNPSLSKSRFQQAEQFLNQSRESIQSRFKPLLQSFDQPQQSLGAMFSEITDLIRGSHISDPVLNEFLGFVNAES